MPAVPSKLRFQCKVHFSPARHDRKQMVLAETPPPPPAPKGLFPRIIRLMALAIRLEGLPQRAAWPKNRNRLLDAPRPPQPRVKRIDAAITHAILSTVWPRRSCLDRPN